MTARAATDTRLPQWRGIGLGQSTAANIAGGPAAVRESWWEARVAVCGCCCRVRGGGAGLAGRKPGGGMTARAVTGTCLPQWQGIGLGPDYLGPADIAGGPAVADVPKSSREAGVSAEAGRGGPSRCSGVRLRLAWRAVLPFAAAVATCAVAVLGWLARNLVTT
jgi:hypothetical protein